MVIIENLDGKACFYKAVLISGISCQNATGARVLQLIFVLWNQGGASRPGLTPCWNNIKAGKSDSPETGMHSCFTKSLV